jgi:enoyl-[acyl-carrier protein] reductase III
VTDEPELETVRRFEGSTALITGGTRGIGLCIAERLAREGAQVVVTWHRNREAADAAESAIERAGGRPPVVLRAALERKDGPEQLARDVRRAVDRVDLLVANAAFGVGRDALDANSRHWELTMRANAESLLVLVRLLPDLRSVVSLSSLGAVRAQRGYGLIGVSKAAQEALVRQLALELAPRARINALSPGLVDTGSARALFSSFDSVLEAASDSTPAGRLATGQDVASAAAFLLSDEASMITGQTLAVDGGYSIQA